MHPRVLSVEGNEREIHSLFQQASAGLESVSTSTLMNKPYGWWLEWATDHGQSGPNQSSKLNLTFTTTTKTGERYSQRVIPSLSIEWICHQALIESIELCASIDRARASVH